MQPQELRDRSRRAAGRFRPLEWLALVVVIGSALLSSRPTAVAPQAGGLPPLPQRIAALEEKVAALEAASSLHASQIAALQAALANEITARQAADTTLQSNINAEAAARQTADTTLQTSLNAESAARAAADTALQDRAAALENKTQYVSIDGGEMFITGTNLNIRNGLGATNGNPADPASTDPASTQVNGKGNLIVGYNEFGTHGGSHNFVIGVNHSYHSFAGLLAGKSNNLWAPYASITGGAANSVTGQHASVTGGLGNTAAGNGSAVTGGTSNRAVSENSAVHGGSNNRATGLVGSLLGGISETQSETWTVTLNTVNGPVKVTGYK
jgi:hypothetical protein